VYWSNGNVFADRSLSIKIEVFSTQIRTDDEASFLSPNRHKKGNFGDVLTSQSLGSVLKNQTQQH